MLAWLASFVAGPLLNSLVAAYRERLAAQNTQDAKAVELAEAELRAEIDARAEANKLIIAEQGRWYTAIVRPLFAAPFVIYLWKIVVIDKVLALSSTDPLSSDMMSWGGIVLTAYFGGRSLEKVAKVFANRKR